MQAGLANLLLAVRASGHSRSRLFTIELLAALAVLAVAIAWALPL